ncbi:hypothetical protein ACFL20_08300 [Spirochaetota bacterium]
MKKLESTKAIPINSILRVYKESYGYSKVKIIDINEYFFGAYCDKDFSLSVNDGDIIEAYLWVENIASYEFSLEVIGRLKLSENSNDVPQVLFFRHTDNISWSKDRKCLKAKVNMPIKFFTFNTGEESKSISTEEVSYQYGNIIELSDREALIRESSKPPGNKFLKAHLIIDGKDIELVGRVKPVEKDGETLYDVSFFRMSEEDRGRLLDYVFSVYRE